ncbi:MAG: PfkB family carbohydrate kinase [Acidobacteriota bacterium]
MSLLVIGTVAFDSVTTPHGSRESTLGGSATYFAVAASFFTPVSMVAVVGEDFPADILERLGRRGIDTSGVVTVPGKTFRWKGEYGDDLNEARTLETHLNVLEVFKPELSGMQRRADHLFLANIDPVLQKEVQRQVESPHLVAADTMNFWIEGKRAELAATLADVDLLVINDGEARMLAGESSLPRAAVRIRTMGPESVIIKRGEHGVALFTASDTFVAPAFPVENVLDPTGAGDSFAGGMMGYLAHRDRHDPATLRQAIIYGSTLASFNVEDFSMDRLLALTRSEIDARYRAFTALTHFDPIGAGSEEG